jgi:hypothetical protein
MQVGAGMNARKVGIVCSLLAAMSTLVGCESPRAAADNQFQKQVKRAEECRELQDKLVADQPLSPERGEEITDILDRNGCTARLPSADATVGPRFPGQR